MASEPQRKIIYVDAAEPVEGRPSLKGRRMSLLRLIRDEMRRRDRETAKSEAPKVSTPATAG